MTTVKDLLERKSQTNCRPLCTVSPSVSVLEAVHTMNRERIGALVVLQENASSGAPLAGIFTERDVLTRVVGELKDPGSTSVGDVMTPEPVVCHLHTTIEQVKTIVTQHRVRHLPVVDDGHVLGLITSGDVVAYEAAEQEATIRHLHDYITG